MLPSRLWYNLALVGSTVAYGFDYTAPTECGTITVTWSDGQAPFNLLMVPDNQPPRNYTINQDAYNSDSKTWSYTTQLTIASQTNFLMVLSDGTGFGSQGISARLTVGNAQNGNTCNTAGPSLGFTFATSTPVQPCHDFVFSSYSKAQQPVTFYGLIPEGTPFTLHPPQGSSSYTWNTNVAPQTTLLILAQDSRPSFGGTTSFLGVGSSNDLSCLNSTSPGTTTRPGATATSHPSSSTASSSASASSSAGAGGGGGSSNAAAIGGGVAGGVVGLAALAGILFFLFKRRNDEKRRNLGTAAYFEGKKRRRRSIDLLPDGADPGAHYPLNTGFSHNNNSNPNLPHEYEPVPYVLPPPSAVTAPISEYQANAGPYRDEPDDATSSGAALTKAQMAARDSRAYANSELGTTASNAPARFVVHRDGGSIMGSDEEGDEEDEDEIVELPPQYNSLGAVIPQRRPSRRTSTRKSPLEGTAAASTSASGSGSGSGSGGSRVAGEDTGAGASDPAPPASEAGGSGSGFNPAH